MPTQLARIHAFEREQRSVTASIEKFDRELWTLHLKKLDIECDLHYAEMIKMMKQQERECLRGIQDADHLLRHKRASLKQEREDIVQQLSTDQVSANAPKQGSGALEESQGMDEKWQQQFDALVPLSHPQREVLLETTFSRAPCEILDPTLATRTNEHTLDVNVDHPRDVDEVTEHPIIQILSGFYLSNRHCCRGYWI